MAAFKMRETNPDFKFKVDENVDIEKVIADNADSVVEISLSEIKPFKFRNVGQAFGIREAEVDVLAESIEKYGQLTPCAVREYKDAYQMISGHKRLAAARKLGLETLRCIIVECDDKTAFELVKHFNIQRDKPLPSELMKLVKQTKEKDKVSDDDEDLTVTEIAKLFGVGRKHIYRCYSLRHLPVSIHNAVDEGMIGTNDIEKIVNGIAKEHLKEFGEWVEYEDDKKISSGKLKKIYEYSEHCISSGKEFTIDSINEWLNNYDSKHNGDNDEEGKNSESKSSESYFAKIRSQYKEQLGDKSESDISFLIDKLLAEHFGKENTD